MKSKTYIIHFQPVFYYPPAQNLIKFLLGNNEIIKIATIKIEDQPLLNENIENNTHYVFTRRSLGGFLNVLKLLYFNYYTLLSIIKFKPSHIIYYETLSALPAILYKRYFDKKVKIICHYHELNAKADLSKETRSLRLIRKIEKKNYKLYDWISQTNEIRKKVFIEDYKKYLNESKVFTMPNYPPKSWAIDTIEHEKNNTFKRFILIGSIHVDKMYLKEFCAILEQQNFAYKFDIYSFYIDSTTLDYIGTKNYIKYKGKILYQQIPQILKDYDIGVILYNPKDLNFLYNAPNKLFEYYICGLDVLFPSDLNFSRKYITQATYPIIKDIDFSNNAVNLDSLLAKKDLKYQINPYTAEDVFKDFYNILFK